MEFKQALAKAAKQGPAQKGEVITLNEYIDRVAQRPTIAATAHQRIYDMVRAAGSTDGLHEGETSYNFFSAELFGLDVRWSASSATSRPQRRATRRAGGSCCCGVLRAARRAPSPGCSSAAWRSGLPPRTAPPTR
jgi:hypothetical protein